MKEGCRAELLAIGTEILIGQISNSHAQYLSMAMAQEGMFVYHHTTVGDNEERIQNAYALAASRSNVVIVTGGLGPTVDDLTKEVLAKYLNRELYESEEAMQHLVSYFSRFSRGMPDENKKQAMCIEGGELISNPNGTAPGQYIFADGVHYFLLPGPPMEMRPMYHAYVLPKLREVFAENQQKLVSRILHFYGIGESTVDEQIRDLTDKANPTVAPYAGEGEMVLRISATAVDEEAAVALIAPVEAEIRHRFGDYIYGTDKDTLPSVVASTLTIQNVTLAIAESCTGGLVQQLLTDLPGASAYFLGGVVSYDNRIKQELLDVPETVLNAHGAVSEETAKWMAVGVRNRLNSTYGISVTGIAGPDGGTAEKPVGLAYVAIAGPQGTEVFRMQQRGSREQIRIRVAKHVLWRLWRHVQVNE